MSPDGVAPDVGPEPDEAAALIRQLREDHVPRLSVRAAAKRAGISDTHWRNIERGHQQLKDTTVEVRPNDETLAKMALAVGARPDQLDAIEGRQHAAEVLRRLLRDRVRGESDLGAIGAHALDASEAGDDGLVSMLVSMLDRIRDSQLGASQKRELEQLMVSKIAADLDNRAQELNLRIRLAESDG